MGRPGKKSTQSSDDADLFADNEFDLGDFMSSMEDKDDRRGGRRRASMQKLEDRREALWLKQQLQDWDDWES